VTQSIVITAEHASNAVPKTLPSELRARFAEADAVKALASHRGFDLGSLELARALARRFDAPLVTATCTRLVVDLNRSLHHRALLSPFMDSLDAPARTALVDAHWRPHRERVEREVNEALERRRPVLHVAVHSFTPELDGDVRPMDVALLYDPQRPLEKALADRWLGAFAVRRPDLVLARNRPYRGTADGLTTHLRGLWGPDAYIGVEVEINQRQVSSGRGGWQRLVADVVETLAEAVGRRDVRRN
jgi:predicted N-formylglutamate amidohydrolase